MPEYTPPVAIAAVPKLLDLLYPRRCVGCGRFGGLVCGECERSLEPATGPGRCANCSARWADASNCPRCFGLDALDGIRCAFEMEGVARRAVHELKYRYVRETATVMATHMASLRTGTPFDVALSVPLHPRRQRERGFNQAELLLDHLDWPRAPGGLRRSRKTDHQVGLDLGERRTNVRGAFVYEGPTLRGLTVAVIDDVVTTGATVNECAKVLKDHGARAVHAIGFARASYEAATGQPIRD